MGEDDLLEMLDSGELWPPDLTADEGSILSRRGRHLLAMAGIGERPGEVPDVSELEPIAPLHRRRLDAFFVSAMLCFGGRDPIADSLAPHVLAASLRELKGGSAEVAKKACRSIRLMPEGTHPQVRAALEDYSGMEAPEVLDRLRQRRDSVLQGDQPGMVRAAVKSRLDPLVNLLTRHVNEKARPPSRMVSLRRHTSAVAAYAESDVAGAELHHFRPGTGNASDDGDLDSVSAFVDVALSGTPAHRRSEAIQSYRAKAASAQIVSGYMMSPCRWGVMSQRGLERVVRELRAGVRNRRRIDALLVASLLTGRRATDLDAMPMRKEKRASERARAQGRAKDRHRDEEFLVHRLDYMALRTGLGLPAPPARERPDYYRTAEPLVDLPLPSEVLECLRNRGPQPRFDEERFAERARELRTTPARIRGAGHLWLYHSGHDRTVLSRLFGEDLARATPLYYENMAHEKVLGAYAAWYGHINAQLPGHEFRIKRKERELHVGVGSRRVPEAKVVANLLRKHRDFVSGLLEKPRELVRAHDHYAAYTHLVLSLATGLRSVRHPFETINHFCWETSTYFIQDKNVGGNPSPRYVPLAKFAVEQLSHYLAYLSWLQTRLGAYPRRGEYVEAALQGQVPYLFSLDQHPADPRPLAPNLIRNTLEGISHLVPNWPRHFLRSALAARGVRDDVLQALLGHGDMGQGSGRAQRTTQAGHTGEAGTAPSRANAAHARRTDVPFPQGGAEGGCGFHQIHGRPAVNRLRHGRVPAGADCVQRCLLWRAGRSQGPSCVRV